MQDEPHGDPRTLQVEYYPPNGTFSLHYFPYYGKKAQVRCLLAPPHPQLPQPLTEHTGKQWSLAQEARQALARPRCFTS